MNNLSLNGLHYEQALSNTLLYREAGKITKSMGLVFEAYLPGASLGSICRIYANDRAQPVEAEVIGFRDKTVFLMPFEEVHGVHNESKVLLYQKSATIEVSDSLLGRVIDGRGRPLDGKGPLNEGRSETRSLTAKPSDPLKRSRIAEPLDLGIRAVNSLLTVGKGQRMGIFAGSGVGKSVLLGMMAQYTKADINVIALIGERGREVREFIEKDLGEEGLKRSVVVVATSDTSPLVRLRASNLATTVAEYFRDQQKDVLLMMDSVTRFCMAQREVGLALGEPPTAKGYTPSVFSVLPKLLERSGTGDNGGSITGLYTVLVDGDDFDEPIADATRSILDGHIVLTRKLAQMNHYPAIDVLKSASRVMPMIVSEEQLEWSGQIREWMALYQQSEDLIQLGAYQKGLNSKLDQAIAVQDRIQTFLRQRMHEEVPYSQAVGMMQGIVRAGTA